MAPVANMAFDVGTFINSVVDWLATAPIVSSVVGNPLIVALMFTALVLIVIKSHAKVSVSNKTSFKIMFYIFLGGLMLLYLHYFIVLNVTSGNAAISTGRALVAQVVGPQIVGPQTVGGTIQVSPRIDPTQLAAPAYPVTQPAYPAAPAMAYPAMQPAMAYPTAQVTQPAMTQLQVSVPPMV